MHFGNICSKRCMLTDDRGDRNVNLGEIYFYNFGIKTWTSQICVLSLYSLHPLSSFPLVFAFANALMSCVVTMVSNVSDISDAWPGMLLHAHMLQHSLMPHRESGPYTNKHMRTHTFADTQTQRVCKSAKCCLSGLSSCCFLHERRNFLLPRCKPQPVSRDISQSALLRLYAGS